MGNTPHRYLRFQLAVRRRGALAQVACKRKSNKRTRTMFVHSLKNATAYARKQSARLWSGCLAVLQFHHGLLIERLKALPLNWRVSNVCYVPRCVTLTTGTPTRKTARA